MVSFQIEIEKCIRISVDGKLAYHLSRVRSSVNNEGHDVVLPFSVSRRPVTDDGIDALNHFIRRNAPDLLVADMDGADEIIRHHMAAFFCASLIHFERRVRKTSSAKLQRLVQRSLGHLESIRALETEKGWAVCGFFRPQFGTLCEAEDTIAGGGYLLALACQLP
ncbi:hypothetical protein CMQ_8249 [Grosmannia clavigera kw1407]|uniref:Uncharacterized protein n=1 Tax=Grosmannia clavigera (strain kw1407 / UAMH 11150) TaxID=655863 RepID=F0XKP4_GROCL|nr:uncharacterized protein CMQ_8249 [Grosmannia clavigera kw1407]EFX01783.1 hypothetical protein CMQ_8249 [Grosmannia clavigera kw1407]